MKIGLSALDEVLTKFDDFCGESPTELSDASRVEIKALLAVMEAAQRVHELNDSPLPNAALLFDEAMFDLGEALEALKPSAALARELGLE